MFLSLLGKECKIWLKSLLFYAYIVILMLFYITQFDNDVIIKPVQGQKDYGTYYTSDPDRIMEVTLGNLIMEYNQKCFSTYPVGFYKAVYPDEKTLNKIGKIITDLTGQAEDEDGWFQDNQVQIKNGLSFSEFLKKMEQVSGLIGPGSSYSKEKLEKVEISMNYQQAQQEYKEICTVDHITGSYARLFCDYIGIILGILPIFFAVSRVLKDKRSHTEQVLYTKAAGSFSIVWARYLAMVIILFVPVLILSVLPLSQALFVASVNHVSPDYLAFVKYSLLWLLPIILFVTALVYFLGELTGTLLPILAGMILWFLCIFAGSSNLTFVGKNLIPRFNTLGSPGLFQSLLPQLYCNRLCYTFAAVLIVGLTVVIYEKKRGGRLSYYGKIFKNRKG